MTKQQGTWSVGFLLDVSTAVLASDADFETRWRYYVGQAAETLRNHQVSSQTEFDDRRHLWLTLGCFT
jgi:hypothetical protein